MHNVDLKISLDNGFWILVIAVIALVLALKYRKELKSIFSGVVDMSK